MPRGPARAGLTLVETLMALALTALLGVLLMTSWFALQRALGASRRYDRGPGAARAVLRTMARELTTAFECQAPGAAPFKLETESDPLRLRAELSFTAPVPDSGETDPRWYPIRALHYAWQGAPDGDGRLVRIARALRGPAAAEPPVTNVVLRGVTRFAVQARFQEGWKDRWPVEGARGLPEGVRLTLETEDGAGDPPAFVDVLIPAGNEVRSRIERGGSTVLP